jgi:hypothetical protein
MSRALLALSLLLLGAATSLHAQDGPSPQRDLNPMERWEQLKPNERAKMLSRYERWKSLSKDQQATYQRRAEEGKRAGKEALRLLRPADRASFDLLDSETKAGVLRELTHIQLAERGHRLREKFPKECQERLKGAGPEERRVILDEFRKEELQEASRRALKELGKELKLSASEIAEIRSMNPERRHEELLALKRRTVELGRMDNEGSPDLSKREWERMSELPPREFAREWFGHRERTDRSKGSQLKRQLHEMLCPTLDELVEISRVPELERRSLTESLVRKRIDLFMETEEKVPKELLELSAGLSDHEMVIRLREFVRPSRGGRPRDGRSPEEGKQRRGPRDSRPNERGGSFPKEGSPGGPRGPGGRPRPEGRPPPHPGGSRGAQGSFQ